MLGAHLKMLKGTFVSLALLVAPEPEQLALERVWGVHPQLEAGKRPCADLHLK